MDSFLITLLVIAIAGLSNWLQHRAQSKQETPLPPSPGIPPQPRPPARHPATPRPVLETNLPKTIERELRRLLGGEDPALPEAHPARRPVQTVPPVHAPVPPRPNVAHMVPPQPVAPAAPVAAVSFFGASDLAFSRAQNLHESVALRMRHVDQQTDSHRADPGRKAPALGGSAIGSIHEIRRNPEAARRAFVASLVFGGPKAFED